MSSDPVYKRGQVEWVLWQYFAAGHAESTKSPTIFKTRIKRLLELDRDIESYPGSAQSHDRYAFFDDIPEGRGTDVSYSPFNAFILAIALDLLDAGFKQSEIVFLLKHIRKDLAQQYEHIDQCPPVPGQRIAVEDRPEKCPTFEHNGFHFADCRLFMVINKVEITEAFPSTKSQTSKETPLVIQPKYCRGVDALTKELHRMNYDYRKALVIELAEQAVMTAEKLKQAPITKRGRR